MHVSLYWLINLSPPFKVHHMVYDDIDQRGLYDLLRSTRHFGGLLWYLMTRQLLKGILEEMLEKNL